MDHRINDVNQATWWNHIEGCSQKQMMDIAVLTTKLEIYDPKRMALRKNPMFVVAGPSSSMHASHCLRCIMPRLVYHSLKLWSTLVNLMINCRQNHSHFRHHPGQRRIRKLQRRIRKLPGPRIRKLPPPRIRKL